MAVAPAGVPQAGGDEIGDASAQAWGEIVRPGLSWMSFSDKSMAESEIEAFNALRKVLSAVSIEAVGAADEAAAEVYLRAAVAAAPIGPGNKEHPSGQLRESIAIVRSNRTALLSSQQGGVGPRVFVGPTKKKGYYGYFIEHGWIATGPKRRGRIATNATHSQRGVAGGHKIPGHPWFEPAIKAAEARAMDAAQTAFDQKLKEIDSRT